MQQDEIYAQLTAIFHDLFDDDSLVLTPASPPPTSPSGDSFNHINLIVAIESRFKIKFQTANWSPCTASVTSPISSTSSSPRKEDS